MSPLLFSLSLHGGRERGKLLAGRVSFEGKEIAPKEKGGAKGGEEGEEGDSPVPAPPPSLFSFSGIEADRKGDCDGQCPGSFSTLPLLLPGMKFGDKPIALWTF